MHKIIVDSIELLGGGSGGGNRQGGGSMNNDMGGNDMGGMGGGDMDDMPPPRSPGKPAGRGGFTPPPQNDAPDESGDNIPF